MATNFPIPLLEEIWSRLPLEEVFKMKLVSKEWSRLIDSWVKVAAPKKPPRVLFTYVDRLQRREFRSVTEDHPRHHAQIFKCTKSLAGVKICSPPVSGLVCISYGDLRVDICNFLTGKSVSVNLPECQEKARGDPPMFVGLDLVKDQFKVLYLGVPILSNVIIMPHVFSLEGQQSSWREIGCEYPHSPINRSGIWKDGVLYYGAWSVSELQVMTFNMSTEVFCPIYLAEKVSTFGNGSLNVEMANFKGSIALVMVRPLTHFSDGYSVEMRVMKNEQEWGATFHFQIPHMNITPYGISSCMGTMASGELVFAPKYFPGIKKHRTFHKIEYRLNLCCCYGPSLEYYRCVQYDRFTEELEDRSLQTFLGTVSFINPEELLE